jgi:hypothetical protein
MLRYCPEIKEILMPKEILTYVPIVDDEEWAEYRSFKNAFIYIVARQRRSSRCFRLECRSTQSPTRTINYEEVYVLGVSLGLIKDGKINWGSGEPAEEMILAAFRSIPA